MRWERRVRANAAIATAMPAATSTAAHESVTPADDATKDGLARKRNSTARGGAHRDAAAKARDCRGTAVRPWPAGASGGQRRRPERSGQQHAEDERNRPRLPRGLPAEKR